MLKIKDATNSFTKLSEVLCLPKLCQTIPLVIHHNLMRQSLKSMSIVSWVLYKFLEKVIRIYFKRNRLDVSKAPVDSFIQSKIIKRREGRKTKMIKKEKSKKNYNIKWGKT
jgi:hypothetical protein